MKKFLNTGIEKAKVTVSKIGSGAKRLVRSEKANTAEENTNRGSWWIFGIAAIVIVFGVVWHVIGNAANAGQTTGIGAISNVSSQSGLKSLTTAAEGGSGGGYTASGASGFAAP